MSATSGDGARELSDAEVEPVRRIFADRPDVVEEPAWTGLRWRVGTTAVANLVLIDDGWPPAYAEAAGTTGPQCVLTVRADRAEVEALTAESAIYFAPAWGTRWTPSVLGIRLDDHTDWTTVAELADASYVLATTKRTRK